MLLGLLLSCSVAGCGELESFTEGSGPATKGVGSDYAHYQGGLEGRDVVLVPTAAMGAVDSEAGGTGASQTTGDSTAPTANSSPATPATDATPPPPNPKSGTVNSLDTVVDDMRLRNDFILRGYEHYQHGWYVGPGEVVMGNNPSFTNVPTWSPYYNNPEFAGVVAKAMLPWVVVFDGVNHAAANAGVEIRNMKTYIKSRARGKWELVGGPVRSSGTYYGKPGTSLAAINETTLASYDTGSIIKIHSNPGYHWHGWWVNGRVPINPGDIEAIFVTLQGRLVVADGSKADDRSRAQLGIQVGADYYVDTNYVYSAYAPAIGISRTKKLTNEWQAFSFTTLNDVGSQQPGGGISEAKFRAAPPPLD